MNAMDRYNSWIRNVNLDDRTKKELEYFKNDENEINERFYKDLEFGTAGLRGIMGAGSARMNVYTVSKATQGLANFLNKKYKNPSVAIAYDSRNNSVQFASTAAAVLAANDIKVHIFKKLQPTPTLSFAVRELKCSAGIVVTASHNPAEYNGYKVYDPNGCQLNIGDSDEVTAYVDKLDIFRDVKLVNFTQAIYAGKIDFIDDELVTNFIEKVKEQSLVDDKEALAKLKVVYTPLNGAGKESVMRVLEEIGIKNVTLVSSQAEPDGDFPTCTYPNPENEAALKMGLIASRKLKPDILIATDPDADRVGTAVLHGGDFVLVTGNEIGVLLMEYIFSIQSEKGILPANSIAVKSIVTTKMAAEVCKFYGVELIDVLTGFKFIGEQINCLEAKDEENRYVFGFEESYGYLAGTHVRDKDAVVASMLICEMTAYYKAQGKTLIDILTDLYEKYGYFKNQVDSYEFKGISGSSKMTEIMDNLRNNGFVEIEGDVVVKTLDYKKQKGREVGGDEFDIALPSSNVLEFILKSGSSIIVRPSGTEPKIKLYISAQGETDGDALEIVSKISKFMKKFIN